VATPKKPTYFATPAPWRAWLERNHASATELLVGFHKRGSGKASITWPESVDQALCFGWIDGHRKRIDDARYTIRFTPRKPGSTWSSVNVRKVKTLVQAGLMTPAGTRAFRKRSAENSGIYGHEQNGAAKLKRDEERLLRADKAAWTDWQKRPPSYRKVVTWWIVSAKKPETRARRLAILIRSSAAGAMVPPMIWSKKK
jgi:uncharacterized protein YdeI (YjbR/CyaY-like superfamily)